MYTVSYLGLGIPKKNNELFIKELKESLTVRPLSIEGYGKKDTFPVYRENSTKIYIPKYFEVPDIHKELIKKDVKNIERLGTPINLKFSGSLRHDQKEYVDNIESWLNEKDACIMSAATGTGKCFGSGTKVLMFDGSIKEVQNICINDTLMGDDNKPRIVTSIASGISNMYVVMPTSSNRLLEEYIVNEEHVMTVHDIMTNMTVDIPFKLFLKNQTRYLGLRKSVEYSYSEPLNMDPELYGKILARKVLNIIYNLNRNNTNDELIDELMLLRVSKRYKTCLMSQRISFLQSFLSSINRVWIIGSKLESDIIHIMQSLSCLHESDINDLQLRSLKNNIIKY